MSKQDEKNNFDSIYGIGAPKRGIPWLLVAAVALVLIIAVLLAVFLVSYFSVVHLSSVDNGESLIDKKREITYLRAPMCYEPVAIWSNDEYAKYGKQVYYEVKDADPNQYLCYKDAEIGLYELYYAEGITLPSLAEFGASYTRVCASGIKTIMMHSIDEKTSEIVSYFLSAPTVDYKEISNVKLTYDLKFMSEKYGFMYYTITFLQTSEEECYLYDREAKRCVKLTIEEYTEAILGNAS